MTSVSYLAEAGSYNAVTIEPFQGVCGLNLFLNKKDDYDVKKNLENCLHFCRVFDNIENQDEALKLDVMIYFGLKKLFDDAEEEDRTQWKIRIDFVSKTITLVLASIDNPEKKKDIKLPDLRKSINILLELRNLAERTLSKPDEKVFYG